MTPTVNTKTAKAILPAITPNFARPTRTRNPAKKNAKGKSDAIKQRLSLPFFKADRGSEPACWWNVKPTGDYSLDLATGKEYARAFLPSLVYNAGASDLACIISGMATAGRAPGVATKCNGQRAIDNIALGFMLEIGGILQSSLVTISIAATVIKKPDRKQGDKLVKLIESGGAFRGLGRASLFNDPNATIFQPPGTPA